MVCTTRVLYIGQHETGFECLAELAKIGGYSTIPSRSLSLVTVHRRQADGLVGITDFTLLDTGSAQFVPSSTDVKLTVIKEASVLHDVNEVFQQGLTFCIARPSTPPVRHRLHFRV